MLPGRYVRWRPRQRIKTRWLGKADGEHPQCSFAKPPRRSLTYGLRRDLRTEADTSIPDANKNIPPIKSGAKRAKGPFVTIAWSEDSSPKRPCVRCKEWTGEIRLSARSGETVSAVSCPSYATFAKYGPESPARPCFQGSLSTCSIQSSTHAAGGEPLRTPPVQ